MKLLFLFVLTIYALKDVQPYVFCKGKLLNISRRHFICCGNRIQFKSGRSATCCLGRVYNPMSQECCGGKVYNKRDINSGCCYGKFYQRGIQQCCGKQLIDSKTHGCCRNVPFMREYSACCNGERVANLFFLNATVEPLCCKNTLYDPTISTCCAQQLVPLIAGKDTACCKSWPYDKKNRLCCNGKIEEKSKYTRPVECCGDRFIDPKAEYCCNDRPTKRVFRNMGCCRLGVHNYQVFDADRYLCCDKRIQPKRTKSTSCCGSYSYDVETHICCATRIIRRTPSIKTERCCGARTYNRDKKLCCAGRLLSLPPGSQSLCCGRLRYDRRKFKCLRGNKLKSLRFEKKKDA